MEEQVIILHGIARSSKHMRKLAKFLENNNYIVHNLDYPSTSYELQALVKFLHNFIEIIIDLAKPVHFVGYSMGGLIIRMYLNKYPLTNLGKVVQLATPNNGSEVVNFFKNWSFFKKFYGPAGQQLITNQKSIETYLTDRTDYPLGIIAGNFCVDPFCYFLLPKPHDGKVSVVSTKLSFMTAHIVVRASHLFFPFNKKVHSQTLSFLRTATFLEV